MPIWLILVRFDTLCMVYFEPKVSDRSGANTDYTD